MIEHLPDPDAVLEVAATNLEPGGVLAIATPNPQSTQFKLMGAHWAHVDAPRHLILLLDAQRRAETLGLRQVAVTTSDPSGRHWNRVGWEYGMRRRPAAGPAPNSVAWTALALTVALRPLEHRWASRRRVHGDIRQGERTDAPLLGPAADAQRRRTA